MRTKMLAGLGLVIVIAFGMKVQAAEWQTDYAKASTNAAKAGRFMMLDFCGSDWCGWCMKLDKEVFKQKDFMDYAKTNLVCIQLDFPRQKKLSKMLQEQNTTLAKKYEIQGYPTVIILSPEGDLVGRTGYQEGGPKKYVDSLKEMIAAYIKQHPKKESEKKADVNTPVAGGGK